VLPPLNTQSWLGRQQGSPEVPDIHLPAANAGASSSAAAPAEEKAMGMLRSDSEMCHEFVSIVADPVIDKLT